MLSIEKLQNYPIGNKKIYKNYFVLIDTTTFGQMAKNVKKFKQIGQS